ncbi:MAG: D-glycero-beta-D-manno-heptose-7-phosphate kinase [bacterium]
MKDTLNRLSQLRILVMGDLMLDHYQWGDAERISPEAPVPVVKVRGEESRLGGAANVVHNLAALGCRVGVCGLVGSDESGGRLREMLETLGAAINGVLVDDSRPTTVKMRVMAQNQQLLRCDWESTAPVDSALLERISAFLSLSLREYDGVILSDYGKGLFTDAVASHLIAACHDAGIMVVVDPKGREFSRYHGAACLTPNSAEAAAAAEVPIETGENALAAAERLSAQLGTERICVTRGAEGVLAYSRTEGHRFLPAKAREVYDVTGAGDTFISVLGALIIGGTPFFESAELANLAAAIVVGKVGTATATIPEMLNFMGEARKVFAPEEIGPLARSLREQGLRVAFTNGCFDLLHAGHIQYLRDSRERGDVLIVGLNSDASVRRLKGEGRPVIGEEDRAHLLTALAFVDYVVIFEEDTPLEMIRAIQPHVLTKGEDYTVEAVVGHDLVGQWGGEVALIPLKENRSTSAIIDKIVAERE